MNTEKYYNGISLNDMIMREKLINNLYSISHFVYDSFDENYLLDKNIKFISSVSIQSYQKSLYLIKNTLCFKILEIENNYFKSIYFENNNGFKGIIVVPQKELITMDPKIFNKDISVPIVLELINLEKNEYFEILLKDKKSFPFDEIIRAIQSNISYHLNLSDLDYKIQLMDNSLDQYINYFNNIQNQEEFHDIISEKIYNHAKVFSYFYNRIFKIISDVLPEKKSGYSFHDIGSETAILPAIILKLEIKMLMNVNISKIIASDYVIPEKYIKIWIEKYQKMSNNKTFVFRKLDLLDDNADIPDIDITVLIDVLEHLPDDESAIKSMLKVWDCTKEILIIHVPLENKENMWFEHNILFTQEKIRKWSLFFKDGIFLSDSYKDLRGCTLTDFGFLIMKKR